MFFSHLSTHFELDIISINEIKAHIEVIRTMPEFRSLKFPSNYDQFTSDEVKAFYKDFLLDAARIGPNPGAQLMKSFVKSID